MTTIAFDGVTLAADGQVTGSYVHQESIKKIRQLKNNWYVTGAGSLSMLCSVFYALEQISEWPRNTFCEEWPTSDDDCEIMTVSPEGLAMCFDADSRGHGMFFAPPLALGSGDQAAMAVMLHGGDAVAAVQIAARLDSETGGTIHAVNVKTGAWKTYD